VPRDMDRTAKTLAPNHLFNVNHGTKNYQKKRLNCSTI